MMQNLKVTLHFFKKAIKNSYINLQLQKVAKLVILGCKIHNN